MRWMRALTVAVCVALCAAAPFLGLMTLNLSLRRHGLWALLLALVWLLAGLAWCFFALGWVRDRRWGARLAWHACALGGLALLSGPLLWPRDMPGMLMMEILVCLPAILLAVHMARFHALEPRPDRPRPPPQPLADTQG